MRPLPHPLDRLDPTRRVNSRPEIAPDRARGKEPAVLDVLVLRDPRESAAKCSLTPLRGQPGIRFLSWKHDRRFDVGTRVLLHAEGEEITAADAGRPLLVIDCAWRRVPTLLATCDGDLALRRLPKLATAYPRKSLTFADPEQGLASIEALYAALALLGCVRRDLLAHYRWADQFLAQNPGLPGAR
jgi:pre-rRNA-processing protein TSR3